MSENINHRQIHWFPGHMMKTLRLMEQCVHQVDVVLELLDARIPCSSLNPEVERIAQGKPRLYVLNKSDLADPDITRRWVAYFRTNGSGCVAISSRQRTGMNDVKKAIDQELMELLAHRAKKGADGAAIRMMVTGIPNVGKSTFINCFVGAARTKTADRPGVTRGKQWVHTGRYDLLDMPGVLWKKFEDENVAANLAFIGSIRDEILDVESLACNLLNQLRKTCPQQLVDRYKLSQQDLEQEPYGLLEAVGRKRGMLMSGGIVNTERAAIAVVDEFRASKLGRISLESPPASAEQGATTSAMPEQRGDEEP